MYLLLLAVIYLAFISLGLPDSLLGSAWPTIRTEFGVPLSYMGMVSMIISGGTIISGLMSERLTKRFKTKMVTFVSVLLTAVALFGFSTVTEFYQMCLWAIPYGLGAGAIDAALNNYVALHYSCHCSGNTGDTSVMEGQQTDGDRERGNYAFRSKGCPQNKRSALPFAGLSGILCGGSHHHAVGKQLPGRHKRYQ